MSAGINAIFVKSLNAQWSALSLSAVTTLDGTDSNVQIIFVAGADGSKIDNVHIQPMGTNVGPTAIRFWINNGSSPSSAVNNSLIHEETLVGYTLTQLAAAPLTQSRLWKANLILPAGYRLLSASGQPLSGGMQVTAIGGDY